MTKEEFKRLKNWVKQNNFKPLECTDEMIFIHISNDTNITLWSDGIFEIFREQQETCAMLKFINRTSLQMKQILEGLRND